ncbi:uncharacterized protein LOC122502413 [Leptopilina heterotoma]|uniref:uncharacterized protein LOC122502413 n=1 Tax=Leptopilina heterotoma TaxID=63436 RepID=UPI001CA8F943|nr:uncharacterized protein LOC122502413 [Leptopilina heterotoma]
MGVTSENYDSAWATLKKRYENQRVIINAHLNSFMSLPVITNESVKDLKILRDSTAEGVQALKTLGHNVADALLVFVVVGKLARPSLVEWEKLLGDRSDFPTYQELENFLSVRIRTLEAIETSKDNQKSQISKANNKSVDNKGSHRSGVSKTFTISTSKTKCLCDVNHLLYQCDKFKSLSVKDKRLFIKERKLCYNCFRGGHTALKCFWKMTCKKCKGKHNTMLHIDQSKSENSKMIVISPDNKDSNSPLEIETS